MARKPQGGGIAAALAPDPTEVAPEPAPDQPPLPGSVEAPPTYLELFKAELGARVRFEISHAFAMVRVIGHFPDVGCNKTWDFPFAPGWAEEALTTIRAWKKLRLAQAI